MATARGTFEVKISPQPLSFESEGTMLGRMTIEKTFQGDLVATSQGEMLTAMAAVAGSGAYVAVERVSGTLQGRSGTFALQHRGTLSRGEQSLLITVVPDSGTGDLAGISGALSISIEAGKHSYELEYDLGA